MVTMILSSFMTNEKFKYSDYIFLITSLLGVTIVSIGIIKNNEIKKDELNENNSTF